MYNNQKAKMKSRKTLENKLHLEKLTPVNSADIRIYEDALNTAFIDDDIKNIALSGAYGSGKSSIMQTYIKQNKKYKFLQISLANFKEGKENKTDLPIEGKIINQLVQQINPGRITQTAFKIKHKFGKFKIFIWTMLISLLIASICYLKFEENLISVLKGTNYQPISWIYSQFTTQQISGIFICVVILCSIIIISQLVKLFGRKLSIHRLKFLNTELEIFDNKNNSSIFDTEIQEIIYLIEQANIDAIIFEDIDRFNSVLVLERIREINIILNNRYKRNRKTIKFFYLIKDELLEAKERVKFFDLIIPVVPVLDGSNSYDMFINLLQNDEQIYKKLDTAFLQDLSLYISDFRLLKNIINELKVYALRIDNTELNYNKLLAILTYKSIFPKDFSQLQEGQGYVFNLFNNKAKLSEDKISKINQAIKSLEGNINDGANRSELSNLQNALSLLISKPLKDLLNQENIDKYFNEICETDYTGKKKNGGDFNEIKENPYYPLIKYLIRNGFIDESYPSYMTYFYGISISQEDRIFLRSITDQQKKDPNYKLDSPASILNRCSPYYFERTEILNYDLLSYIIGNKEEYNSQLDQITSQIEQNNNLDFINGYMHSSHDFAAFVDVLNLKWHSCFNNLIQSSNTLSDELLYRFSLATLKTADDDILKAVNINRCLTNYISDKSTYLDINNPDIKICMHAFEILEVKFNAIDTEHSNQNLLKAVYENSMYVLSFQNISMFIKLYLFVDDMQKTIHSNYSILCGVKQSSLYKYVRENMDAYMNIYINNCDGLIDDTEDAIKEILNTKNLAESIKTNYINLLKQNSVHDISQINSSSLKSLLISKHIAVCNEGNITDYFVSCRNKLDETMISFIEETNDLVLDFRSNEADETLKGTLDKMAQAFLVNEELSDEKFWKVISALPQQSEYEIDTVSQSHLKILITKKYVNPTLPNLNVIRTTFPELVFDFIETNFSEYLNLGEIPKDEMLDILPSDKFSNEQKIQALDHGCEYQISIVGKNYPYEILPAIMNRYLCDDDLNDMFENYDGYPENTKSIIYNKAKNLLKETILDVYLSSISIHLVRQLILDSDIELVDKVDLFDSTSEKFNKDEVKIIITKVNPVFNRVFNTRKKTIPITEENRTLLEIAKKKGIIKQYTERKKGKNYFVTLFQEK